MKNAILLSLFFTLLMGQCAMAQITPVLDEYKTMRFVSWETTVNQDDTSDEIIYFQDITTGDYVTVNKLRVSVADRLALQKEILNKLRSEVSQLENAVQVHSQLVIDYGAKLDDLEIQIDAVIDNGMDGLDD